ncbi:hypothetical protein PAXRUDRAFT_55533, partial [Paxillus rubicundulus Ve08.2h10]
MGVTLISISKLAAAGYAALFCDSICRIFDPHKKVMGEIPLNNGLYRVKHQSTNTLGMVEGVCLNLLHTTMGQCEACEYVKATCKPIGKEHEPTCCETFGDKVHTDLWGPSPIQ